MQRTFPTFIPTVTRFRSETIKVEASWSKHFLIKMSFSYAIYLKPLYTFTMNQFLPVFLIISDRRTTLLQSCKCRKPLISVLLSDILFIAKPLTMFAGSEFLDMMIKTGYLLTNNNFLHTKPEFLPVTENMAQNATWSNKLPGAILYVKPILGENFWEWAKLLWNIEKMRLLNIYIEYKVLWRRN